MEDSLTDIEKEDGEEYENEVMNNPSELSGIVDSYNYLFEWFCCLHLLLAERELVLVVLLLAERESHVVALRYLEESGCSCKEIPRVRGRECIWEE